MCRSGPTRRRPSCLVTIDRTCCPASRRTGKVRPAAHLPDRSRLGTCRTPHDREPSARRSVQVARGARPLGAQHRPQCLRPGLGAVAVGAIRIPRPRPARGDRVIPHGCEPHSTDPGRHRPTPTTCASAFSPEFWITFGRWRSSDCGVRPPPLRPQTAPRRRSVTVDQSTIAIVDRRCVSVYASATFLLVPARLPTQQAIKARLRRLGETR